MRRLRIPILGLMVACYLGQGLASIALAQSANPSTGQPTTQQTFGNQSNIIGNPTPVVPSTPPPVTYPTQQAPSPGQFMAPMPVSPSSGVTSTTAAPTSSGNPNTPPPHEEVPSQPGQPGPKPPPLSALVPAGTMAPITLRATLQKNADLYINLKQILQLALGQDIAIKLQDATVKQSQATVWASLSQMLPDIIPGYSQSSFKGGIQVFGGAVISVVRTTIQPQLTLNYTLYTGGRNIFALQASRKRRDAQKKLDDDTRQDILRQVALGYYDLQMGYWQRSIALEAIKNAKEVLALNEARLKAGVGIKLDVLQSQSNLANQEQNLITAENAISISSNHLAQLLNFDFEVNVAPATLESTITKLVPEGMTGPQLLEIAKLNNPKLKSLYLQMLAGREDVKTAVADLFPQIMITAYKNKTGPTWPQTVMGRFAGVQASWNLLQGLGVTRFAEIDQAKANQKIAQLNFAQANRLLEENLANAIVNMKALEERITVSKEAVEYAKGAYEQALGRLKGGVGTNLDVEAALVNLNQARSNLAAAFLTYNEAEVTLIYNLGLASVDTLTSGYQLSKLPTKSKISVP